MPRILLAEDDVPLREALEEALRSYGFAVRCAGDLEEAVRELDADTFDVVVTDVDMPGNGHALAAAVRARRPGLPVILLTGVEEPDGHHLANAAGAFDYLVKPVGLSQLCATLERACRR
jgi:DNA-binding response OmpR family regulator